MSPTDLDRDRAPARDRRGDARPQPRSGSQFTARRRHPTARNPVVIPPPRFYLLGGLVVVLTLFGLVMVLSASSVNAFHDRAIGTPWYYLGKQAFLAGFGFVALFVVSRVDYHRWRRLVPTMFVVSVVACMAVFMPGIGKTVNGTTAWISVGPVQGQPSELLKLTLMLYCADLLARRADRMHEPRATIWPVLVVLGGASLIVMGQNDLGTVIVLSAIALAVLFVAGTPLRPLGTTAALLGSVGAFFVLTKTYRRERFLAFLNPGADVGSVNYQIQQSKIAFASGGWTGVGLGASRAKWSYLPEAHTDFISAIVGEELGVIGFAVMVLLLGAYVVLAARIALRAPDRFGMLLSGGITAWVAVQVTINLGAAVGLMPITGLPLPFISFGPSSLVVLMLGSGLLMSVARRSRL